MTDFGGNRPLKNDCINIFGEMNVPRSVAEADGETEEGCALLSKLTPATFEVLPAASKGEGGGQTVPLEGGGVGVRRLSQRKCL